MKIVAGLGNPGAEYSGTRHNVGFDVIRELIRRWQPGRSQMKYSSEIWEIILGSEKVLLVCPLTYMNRSGDAVQPLVRFYQVPTTEVVVICDDMNLPAGRLRWRANGSAGGQKGLSDIIQKLGTEDVPRLRMGIGRPPGRMDVTAFVLGKFRPDEKDLAEIAVQTAADSVEMWVRSGITSVMNQFNRSVDSPE